MQDLEAQHDKSLQILRKKMVMQAKESEEQAGLVAKREKEVREKETEIMQLRE